VQGVKGGKKEGESDGALGEGRDSDRTLQLMSIFVYFLPIPRMYFINKDTVSMSNKFSYYLTFITQVQKYHISLLTSASFVPHTLGREPLVSLQCN